MLRHRKDCDPRLRSTFSCPCGVTDAYVEHQQGLAEDMADRAGYEREAAR